MIDITTCQLDLACQILVSSIVSDRACCKPAQKTLTPRYCEDVRRACCLPCQIDCRHHPQRAFQGWDCTEYRIVSVIAPSNTTFRMIQLIWWHVMIVILSMGSFTLGHVPCVIYGNYYRKISNIRRTKSQNLNDSCLVLLLSWPNPLKPGVKSRMKM